MTEIQTFPHCPICFSKSKLCLANVKDIHYQIKGQYDIFRCIECGTLFLIEESLKEYSALNETAGFDIYESQDYYAYESPDHRTRFGTLKLNWIKKNKYYPLGEIRLSLLDRIAYPLLLPYLNDRLWWIPEYSENKTTFIDIGSGSGKIVKLMNSLGFEAWGTDISDYGSSKGEESGLNIITGDFKSVDIQKNYFDYVYSNHAIEHMPEPHAVFEKVNKILKPGGIGYICVPNANSITSNMFGRYWYLLGTPLHIINYTDKSMKIILEKHGLEVIKIRKVGDYQSIVGSIQAFINRNNGRTSSEGMMSNNGVIKGVALLISYLASMFNVGSHLQVQFRKK